jgi:hypothetical protein
MHPRRQENTVPDFTELDRLISRADPAATLPPPTVIPDPPVGPSRRLATGRSHPRLAVAASALAVVAAAAVVLLVAQFSSPQRAVPSGVRPVTLTAPPPSGVTASPGNVDYTASSGQDFERAKRLLATLRTVVPDGYTLPPMPTGDPADHPWPTTGPDGGVPQAGFFAYHLHRTPPGWSQSWTGWQYEGDTNVTRNGRTGSVGLMVWPLVPAPHGDLCSLLSSWYWIKGNCRMVQSGGKQVALSTANLQVDRGGGTVGGFDSRGETWASYRYPDGTLVMIIQTRLDFNSTTPSLTSPVYSNTQLAALCVDPRFAA